MIVAAIAMLAMIAPARPPDPAADPKVVRARSDAAPDPSGRRGRSEVVAEVVAEDVTDPVADDAADDGIDRDQTPEADPDARDLVADEASSSTPAPQDSDAPDYRWGDGSAPTAAPPPTGGQVGGYLGPTETKELEPADGERKLIVAYILMPLGTLATVTGAVSWWLTTPDQCQRRAPSLSAGECRGLMILNIVRTSYGSLMLASGAVLLGIGLHQRKKHREWTRRHGAYVQPVVGPRAAGLVFGGRF